LSQEKSPKKILPPLRGSLLMGFFSLSKIDHCAALTNSIVPGTTSPPSIVPVILSLPTVRLQRSNATFRPGCGNVLKLN
jgi:hypothetical protein